VRSPLRCWTLTGAGLLGLWLGGCSLTAPLLTIESSPPDDAGSPSAASASSSASVLWQGSLVGEDWTADWGAHAHRSWGFENLAIVTDPAEPFPQILRVFYPAGSASPSVSRRNDIAVGGAQFYADLDLEPRNALRLSYYVRFPEGFDFVKGGKLPGLYGGDPKSGGNIPDGTDGFSTRLMWRRNGDGEVYAYLPTSDDYGTSIGRGAWRFQRGRWTQVEQAVTLNHPDRADGRIQVWVDGALVIDEAGLTFRTVDDLQVDGLFFSTFFGGGDESWATPRDVSIDFADFVITDIE